MSDSDNDKRDRLAADRLRALGRPDLVSADGKLWWNSSNWEPIGLSLNYEIGPPMSTEHHYRHGIERLPWLNLPSKEELRRAKELPPEDPEEIQRHMDELYQAAEKWEQQRLQIAQKPAPTLEEAERLIEAERRQRMAQKSEPTSMPQPDSYEQFKDLAEDENARLVAIKWWTGHTGWLVMSACIAVPAFLTIRVSWWFLIGFPIAILAAFPIQGLLGRVFVKLANGRIVDSGREITWPGNLFIFVVVPLLLLGHLLGKL